MDFLVSSLCESLYDYFGPERASVYDPYGSLFRKENPHILFCLPEEAGYPLDESQRDNS